MGKVINYLDYLKAQKFNDQTINKILVMVDHLHPKIEGMVEDEIAKFSVSKDVYDIMKNDDEVRSQFDFTIITSLCFILSRYLITLANRPNDFNVTEDTLDIFISNLMHGMLKTLWLKK